MKITNKHGFPAWLADVMAWCFGQYERGAADFTVTELSKPAQMRALERANEGKLETDVASIVDLVIGKAVHLFFETALRALNIKGISFEERVTAEYKLNGKIYTVSGQYDAYDNNEETLWDFKVTKAYAAQMGPKEDYVAQLNTYAENLRRSGKANPKRLRNLYIVKDWDRREILKDPSYPKTPLFIMDIELKPSSEATAWVLSRIAEHTGEVIPDCTKEERWERPEKWAAKKAGAERATKLFDTYDEVADFAQARGLKIEHRPGERMRCANYCSAAPFCSSYQDSLKKPEAV